MLRVMKGALVPADRRSLELLRERGYAIGDVLAAELRKPRNPGFHRLVHQFGTLCRDNIEAFADLDAHTVLKRLQLEGNIGCDEIALNFPGIGPCSYRVPRSLAYESMDESEFQDVFRAFARHVSKQYWPSMSPEAIADMAGMLTEQI